MRLYRKILVSTIALALAGQLTGLGAKETNDGGDGVQMGAGSQNAAPAYYPADKIDAQLIADARPMVDKAPDGLFITAPYIDTLLVMNFRVYDSDGNKVMNNRSLGEPLSLMALDLPNGEYHYEAVSVFMLDQPSGQGADYTEEGISRSSGSFSIKDATLVDDAPGETSGAPASQEDASVLDRVIKHSMSLAGVVLDVLVPSAQAANVTVSSTEPQILFDDTSLAGDEWNIWGNTARWGVADILGSSNHWTLLINGAANSTLNQNSMVVDSDGDIHWADGSMHLDDSSDTLSLGWISTQTDISMSGSTPDLRFHDETDTSEAEFELSNGLFRFYGRETDVAGWNTIMQMDVNAPAQSIAVDAAGLVTIGGTVNTSAPILTLGSASTSRTQMNFVNAVGTAAIEWGQTAQTFQFENGASSTIVEFKMDAPTNSLNLASSGNVGIGTSNPAANLNVVDGSTALIRVDNTTASPGGGDQVMFHLQSAAANKVRFVIGNTGGLWTFDNAGQSFQINKAGTGSNEFRVENDGDIVALKNSYATNHINTSSRDSKTDFAEVDEVAVLQKLTELPMTTWRYKIEKGDERHLGPVAEDFQQAFGLSDGKHISTIDASGVALTAIKGLNTVLNERTEQIAELTQANSDLQKTNIDLISANQALDERLTRLENVLLHLNEVAVR